MAVSISSISTNTNDGSSTTIAVTTSESPTATQVGDLVIVIHANDYFTLADMPTPTATGSPTLTSIVNADTGSLTAHIKTWYYIANTGGAQTVSVTESGLADEEKSMQVYVLTGADTSGSPIDGTPASNTSASAVTSQVCNAVTTTNTDSYVITAIGSGGGAASSAYAPPGDITEKYDIRVGGGSWCGGIKQLSASGSTGTFTWTATGASPYAAVTFAIKTAAVATSVAASGIQKLPPHLLLRIVGQRQASPFGDTGITATNAPAEVASATGTAFDATVSIAPNAEATTSTGTAFDAAASVAPNAEATTATGTAFDATVAAGTQPTAASATGTAFDGAASVSPNAEATTATGTAFDTSIAITVLAELTSSTGTAFDATVSTSANVNAPAEATTSTGTAFDASVAVTVGAEVASAVGTAFDAGVNALAVGVATATGTAFDATVIFATPIGANVPFVSTTPAGTFVSEGGIVIVSQTLGGVL